MKSVKQTLNKASVLCASFSVLMISHSVFAGFDEDVKDIALRIMVAERIYLKEQGALPASEELPPDGWAVLRSIQNQRFSPTTKGNFDSLKAIGFFEGLKAKSPALFRTGQTSQRKPKLDIQLSKDERPVIILNDVYSNVRSVDDSQKNLDKILPVARDRKPPTVFKKIFFWLKEKPSEIANIPQLCTNLRTTLNDSDKFELLRKSVEKLPPLTHLEYFDILSEFSLGSQYEAAQYLRGHVFTQLNFYEKNSLVGYMETIQVDIILSEFEQSKIYFSMSDIVQLSQGYSIPLERWKGIFTNQLVSHEGLSADLQLLPQLSLIEAKILLSWILKKEDSKQEKYTETEKSAAIEIVSGKIDPKKRLELNSFIPNLKEAYVHELAELELYLAGKKDLTSSELIEFLRQLSGSPCFAQNVAKSTDGLNRLDGFKKLLRSKFPHSEWTSAELQSMHVSVNLALAAQALNMTSRTDASLKLDSGANFEIVKRAIEDILDLSRVTDVHAPYPKPSLGDPVIRGVTFANIKTFLIGELNRLNPEVERPRLELQLNTQKSEGIPFRPHSVNITELEAMIRTDRVTRIEDVLELLEIINTSPNYAKHVDKDNVEGLGTLVDLRNRLNAWAGNNTWTASDLQQMRVSRNIGALAKLVAIAPRAETELQYRQLAELVHSILSVSDIQDIESNPYKLDLASPKERGATAANLHRYFNHEVAKLRPIPKPGQEIPASNNNIRFSLNADINGTYQK